jgi:alpha-tubulin suppressor-like RCC1 family protein
MMERYRWGVCLAAAVAGCVVDTTGMSMPASTTTATSESTGIDPGTTEASLPTTSDDADTSSSSSPASTATTGDSTDATTSLDLCGNETIDGDEACDDGDQDDFDGCRSDCSPSQAISVFSGVMASGTCALLYDGSGGGFRCWGSNSYGMLGYGMSDNIGDDEPARDGGINKVGAGAVELSMGTTHACARYDGGTVRCWGSGQYGALGSGNTMVMGLNEPPSSLDVVPLGDESVAQVFAGYYRTCVRFASGKVFCWGYGEGGVLGRGNVENLGDDEALTPGMYIDLGVDDVVEMSMGFQHACVLTSQGVVRCWGGNFTGQLGLGHTDNIGDDELPSTAPDVSVGGAASHACAGGDHSCALLESGGLRCWGGNNYGQLGYGHTDEIGDNESPASAGDVDVGEAVRSVACGGLRTCVVTESGSVKCWGHNETGALGYGHTMHLGDDETPANIPPVPLGEEAVEVTAADDHTCALLITGEIMCWGSGASGRLGYGNTISVGDDELPSDVGHVPYY